MGRGRHLPDPGLKQIVRLQAPPAQFLPDLNPPLELSWALGQGVSCGQRRPVLKVWPLCCPTQSDKRCRTPPSQCDNTDVCKGGSCSLHTSQETRNTVLRVSTTQEWGVGRKPRRLAPGLAGQVVGAVLGASLTGNSSSFFLADWGLARHPLLLSRAFGPRVTSPPLLLALSSLLPAPWVFCFWVVGESWLGWRPGLVLLKRPMAVRTRGPSC